MAETKTKATEVRPEDFIDAVERPVRRADGHALLRLMRKVTGQKPKMWGPSIVGFGQYHYIYDSGHQGDICRVGFSPRAAHLVVYVPRDFAGAAALLKQLGKHKTSKACLYINTLADVDMNVLEQLVAGGWAHSLKTHP